LLREVVAPELADAYPQFTASVFGMESERPSGTRPGFLSEAGAAAIPNP
jgi:hypothetical protein